MTSYNYGQLKKDYKGFAEPRAVIHINNQDITTEKLDLAVSDIEVEMSNGYEAGIATFWIFNCYDRVTCEFKVDDIKKYIALGSTVDIYLGYQTKVRLVFQGFIASVNFAFRESDVPGVEITAMDVKGIMMSNNYYRQLTSTNFSDAVKEIFDKPLYQKLMEKGILTSIKVIDTPDKVPKVGTGEQKATDKSIEMVCESDYEFVVKAARKFNYEFFVSAGQVVFRAAKSDSEILMELDPSTGIRNISVEYDITGLNGEIEVRGLDVGKGKAFSASSKFKNDISFGSTAKQLIQNSKKVVTDPTTSDKKEAEYRVSYLMEEMSYRFGTLQMEVVGIPELTPGKFMNINGLGAGINNKFYICNVRQILSYHGYITRVTGKACQLQKPMI